ncbi:MAG: hypothetical protein R3F17_14830 [Planctomycetota bacterium]
MGYKDEKIDVSVWDEKSGEKMRITLSADYEFDPGAKLTAHVCGRTYYAEGMNQYLALGELQREMGRDGFTLLCARFRVEAAQSGMLSQAGDGSLMYLLLGRRNVDKPIRCSVFDEIPRELVSTEAARSDYREKWYSGGDPG